MLAFMRMKYMHFAYILVTAESENFGSVTSDTEIRFFTTESTEITEEETRILIIPYFFLCDLRALWCDRINRVNLVT
jgi:hypothetical protein